MLNSKLKAFVMKKILLPIFACSTFVLLFPFFVTSIFAVPTGPDNSSTQAPSAVVGPTQITCCQQGFGVCPSDRVKVRKVGITFKEIWAGILVKVPVLNFFEERTVNQQTQCCKEELGGFSYGVGNKSSFFCGAAGAGSLPTEPEITTQIPRQREEEESAQMSVRTYLETQAQAQVQPQPNPQTAAPTPQANQGKKFNPYCDSAKTKIDTAIGCIPVNSTDSFIGWFLGWAIGVAGGIAFLFILIAGFMIMTAAGKPERVQAGRELLTASISGLLIIIFSVFLLKLIGVEILKIPGLG